MCMSPSPTIPEQLVARYTLDGRIPVVYRYLDNTRSNAKTFNRKQIEKLIEKAGRRERNYYPLDFSLYAALDSYPVRKLAVAVLGSETPWYEAVCLCYGAEQVVTIDYNPLVFDHPKVTTTTVAHWQRTRPFKLDAALSISSFEHDGLGRYGDPLSPEGDLRAMREARDLLKSGGLLFLAVPVGRDRLVWNAHRIYGRERLPLLLSGWQEEACYGMPGGQLDQDKWVQPIFVLRKP